MAKIKKLTKDFVSKPGCVVITVEGGEKGPMTFDPSKLPSSVQERLPAFAVGHKEGDAAAGRSGKDAEAAIQKVWEGLMKGDWSVRAPATPKVSLAEVASNFSKLSPAEQKAAKTLLDSLNIKLPGM